MKVIVISATLLLALSMTGCQKAAEAPVQSNFALGADISWYTEYETRGHKFYNMQGEEKPCNDVMRDCGLNAVRLRVWVDPAGRPVPPPPPDAPADMPQYQPQPWCDAQDLLVKSLAAQKAGLDVMVDFHYSDWWADPSHQPTPHAWQDHTLEQMCQDVASHTTEVLTLLKEHGVEPRWVQIGNETSNGMCWPTGLAKPDSCEAYARLYMAGYEALKRVLPDAVGIVHLDNGWNPDLYDWNLGGLVRYGAKWDMVGMSLYPYWAHQSDSTRMADATIRDCLDNIRRVGKLYNCPVMITEVGFEVDEEHPEVMDEGRRQLQWVLTAARDSTEGICRGVFYWEPECRPSQYRLGAFTEDGHPTAIMSAFAQ